MDPVVILDIPRLVDLSIGIPNIGNINSTFLHTLLHVIVRKLGLEDYRIEMTAGAGSVQAKELLPYVDKESSLMLTEYKIKSNKEREVVPVAKSGEVKNVFVIEKKSEKGAVSKGARRKEGRSGQSPHRTDSHFRTIEQHEQEQRSRSAPHKSDSHLRAMEHQTEQQKIKEYQNWGVKDTREREKEKEKEKDTTRRSKSMERDDIRKLDDAVSDINAAIADVLPQLIESELSKFKDLKSRIEALEKQVKALSKFVNYSYDGVSSSVASQGSTSKITQQKSTPGTKSAPGFVAKEQLDLLMEGLIKDKDGRLMSKIEDKLRSTLVKDIQAQIMRDLTERMKGECSKTSNDIVNTRIKQIENDLLKAMRDMEEMLNKCQGDELKQMLDSHMSQVMDRLSRVEKRSKANTSAATTCKICPDTQCIACCSVAVPSGRTTPESRYDFPTRSSTPKRPHTSASLKSSTEKIPLPRKLSQKSKSEIEFTPSYRMKGYNEEQYRINKKDLEMEKPIPPAKKNRPCGGYYTTSRTEDRSFREQYNSQFQPTESECSYCLDLEKAKQQKNSDPQGRKLPCGCICTCQGCQQYKDCSELKQQLQQQKKH